MSARSAPRYSRRSFLKFGAVAAAGAGALALRLPPLRLPPPAPIQADFSSLRVITTLPWPGYSSLLFPERLLQGDAGHLDAVLVPAYVAAQLIHKGLLQPLCGPAGRAHDPEGHYTLPFAYRVAALCFPDEATAPATARWEDLWSAAGRSLWLPFGRVIAGAALLRRGYSPNDSHAGHLAQAAEDLRWLGPRIELHGGQSFQAWLRTEKPLALGLADPNEVGRANGLRLPAGGTMLIEYDWVITAGPARAAAARAFIDGQRPAAQTLRTDLPARLIPLMPLPAAAQAQHREVWASLTGQRA